MIDSLESRILSAFLACKPDWPSDKPLHVSIQTGTDGKRYGVVSDLKAGEIAGAFHLQETIQIRERRKMPRGLRATDQGKSGGKNATPG